MHVRGTMLDGATREAKRWSKKKADLSRVRGNTGIYGKADYGDDQVVDHCVAASEDADVIGLHTKWSSRWYTTRAGERNKVGLIRQGKHWDALRREIGGRRG